MTGFERPRRSYYLDDLRGVRPGDVVICKCDMAGNFTPGRRYRVGPGFTLNDDKGHEVIPSARFTYPEGDHA